MTAIERDAFAAEGLTNAPGVHAIPQIFVERKQVRYTRPARFR